MTDNIENIGIKFKKPICEDKMLNLLPTPKGCLGHSYIIDEESNIVTCSKCNKTFNPMSVLVSLARKESRWQMNRERYKEEMERLSERSRTKCQHCGEMTRISKK